MLVPYALWHNFKGACASPTRNVSLLICPRGMQSAYEHWNHVVNLHKGKIPKLLRNTYVTINFDVDDLAHSAYYIT